MRTLGVRSAARFLNIRVFLATDLETDLESLQLEFSLQFGGCT